jgi:hypothetical protein
MATLLAYESNAIGSIVLVLLLGQFALIYRQVPQSPLHTIQIGLIFIGAIMSAISLLSSNVDITWLNLLITFLVVMEEGIGRWLFYRSR